MALLEQWQKVAYNEKADRGELQRFWQKACTVSAA